jgi:hypothetical protein
MPRSGFPESDAFDGDPAAFEADSAVPLELEDPCVPLELEDP